VRLLKIIIKDNTGILELKNGRQQIRYTKKIISPTGYKLDVYLVYSAKQDPPSLQTIEKIVIIKEPE